MSTYSFVVRYFSSTKEFAAPFHLLAKAPLVIVFKIVNFICQSHSMPTEDALLNDSDKI